MTHLSSLQTTTCVLVLLVLFVPTGSPVLDIKPYVPFCDSVPEAVAPQWVAVSTSREGGGSMGSRVLGAVCQAKGKAGCAWRAQGRQGW